MERDKIIAIVLVVGLVFLFVALLSVVAVTGFVLLFVTSTPGEVVDNTPIIDTQVVPIEPSSTTTTTQPDPEPEPQDDPEPEPEPEPEPTATLLAGVTIDEIFFWCPKSFTGEDGLGLNRIAIKNDSGSDLSFSSVKVKVSIEEGSTISANTKSSFKFNVNDEKSTNIYRTNFIDGSSSLLMGKSSGTSGTITVEFPDDTYIEHDYTLKGQDFSDAFCNN